MTEITDRSFGLLIAYLIPGFLLVAAVTGHSPALQAWIGTAASDAPTVGGFLYVTLASVAAGMTVSALRWLTIDWLLHHTGIPRPELDFSKLQPNLSAFVGAAESHYRYYQFYANILVALLVAAAISPQAFVRVFGGLFPAMCLLLGAGLLFWFAARDTLSKYYARTEMILGHRSPTVRSSNHDQRLASPTIIESPARAAGSRGGPDSRGDHKRPNA